MRDLRFALRQLRKNPGFTIVAVVTLALGIGANTAIFSAVNAVLLRPLPLRNSERLVWIWENNLPKNLTINPASPGNLNDWRAQSRSFDGLSAWEGESFNLTGQGEPERVLGAKIFSDFFEVLGVQPILGRAFLAEEDRAGANAVALLSHALWQRRFGGRTNILGETVTVDGRSFTVIGVTPVTGAVPFDHFDLWVPMALDAGRMASHGDRFLRPIGRLKPHVTAKQAQTELSAIARNLEKRYPQENTGAGVNVIPLKDMFTGEMRAPLWVLLGAVGFVLLIACANVANLILARAAGREKEMALRTALGATRLRLARQLFTETFLLCALGTVAGLVLAFYGVQLLRVLVPAVSSNYKVAIPGLEAIGIDRWVLLFTLGLSFIAALLCSLAPALTSSGVDLNGALKEGGRNSVSGFRSGKFRSSIVIAEVALALILLIGTGLMIESFRQLREVRLGFDAHNVLTMSLSLPDSKYSGEHQRAEFFERLVARVRALPGVESAALVNYVPLSGHWGNAGFTIEGRPALATGDFLVANVSTVSPGYFGTMKTSILDGRDFTGADRLKSPEVVIINQAMARRFWSNENPIGKRVNLGTTQSPELCEIIGVADDVKHFGPDTEAQPNIYVCHLQSPSKWMNLIVRTGPDPMGLAAAVRAEVRALDPAQPVYEIQTLGKLVAQSIAPRRFAILLLATFAGVALLLGAIGIYGVLSYTVSKRTHEIGIRMALGARSVDVLQLVVRQGMKLVLIGIGLGLAGALAITRLLQSLLFQVKPFDPVIFLFVTLSLSAVALFACWLPARRAAKVDPMEALRYE